MLENDTNLYFSITAKTKWQQTFRIVDNIYQIPPASIGGVQNSFYQSGHLSYTETLDSVSAAHAPGNFGL